MLVKSTSTKDEAIIKIGGSGSSHKRTRPLSVVLVHVLRVVQVLVLEINQTVDMHLYSSSATVVIVL